MVLVGEDTDILILLLHHAHMDDKSYTSDMRKQNAWKYNYGVLKCQRKSWDHLFAPSCCLSMLLQTVIQLPDFMALERKLHFPISNAKIFYAGPS